MSPLAGICWLVLCVCETTALLPLPRVSCSSLQLNFAQDVVFSFPVTCKGGEWTIVQGLDIDERSAGLLKATGEELVEEKQLALQCLQDQ